MTTRFDNSCVEQGVRMSAMDSASTNASDLRKKFTLQYNKTRQSVITTELSGTKRARSCDMPSLSLSISLSLSLSVSRLLRSIVLSI